MSYISQESFQKLKTSQPTTIAAAANNAPNQPNTAEEDIDKDQVDKLRFFPIQCIYCFQNSFLDMIVSLI